MLTNLGFDSDLIPGNQREKADLTKRARFESFFLGTLFKQ